MKKLYTLLIVSIFLGFSIKLSAQKSETCSVIYVSPSGSGTVGSMNNPSSFTEAIAIADTSQRKFIKMMAGIYTISHSVYISDALIVDGNYLQANESWEKTNDTVTILNINPPLLENDPGSGIIGFYQGIYAYQNNDFEIIDLIINILISGSTGTTQDNGRSIYGVYLDGCSNYAFVRCEINTGSASDGTAGISGADGEIGFQGTVGDEGTCNETLPGASGGAGGTGGGDIFGGSTNGGVGTNASDIRDGGGGGGGGQGGETGANDGMLGGFGGSGGSGASGGIAGGIGGTGGDPGGSGSNGEKGTNGTNGTNGITGISSVMNGYYYIGNGTDGTNGSGGGGGQGGGGGGGQGCNFCDDGNGNGGGGGGGGGQGGERGTGAYGGGSSFCIFLVNNEANGLFLNCVMNPGAFGYGGIGGIGGTAGDGGSGESGGTTCTSEIGSGGDGGDGGAGGAGGNGGDGADGLSQGIYFVSGGQNYSDSTNVTSDYIITAANENCTNSEVTVIKSTGIWDINAAMSDGMFVEDILPSQSSYDVNSDTAKIYYTSTGHKTLGINSSIYSYYVHINIDRELLDFTITPSAATQNNPVNFSTTILADNYNWRIFDASGNLVYSDNTSNQLTYTPLTTGIFTAGISAKDECCGWSIPVYQTFMVNQDNSGLNTFKAGNDVFVYPNPAQNITFVDMKFQKETSVTIKVLDVLGKLLITRSVTGKQFYKTPIDISALKSGTYMIHIQSELGVCTYCLLITE